MNPPLLSQNIDTELYNNSDVPPDIKNLSQCGSPKQYLAQFLLDSEDPPRLITSK